MSTPQGLAPILKIARYTITDHARQKSFIVMVLVGCAFVFFTRSCYHGDYLVNGRMMGPGAMAGIFAKMSFHSIAFAMMVLAALLAMRAFRYDRDHGMQACIMAKPITRAQYVLGKILGIWTLALACMFVLHGTVFCLMALRGKVFMPVFLASSVLCSLNLLAVIVGVLLLSLFLPDFVAFMAAMAAILTSYVSHGVHALNQSRMLESIMRPQGAGESTDVTASTVIYYLWPKLSELQIAAASLIDPGGSCGWGEIYPFLNVIAYGLVLTALLLWRFRNAEIL